MDMDGLFQKEKKSHPNARFLDGALLRDRDTDRQYPVILVAVHYEDPVIMDIRLVTPNSSLSLESFTGEEAKR